MKKTIIGIALVLISLSATAQKKKSNKAKKEKITVLSSEVPLDKPMQVNEVQEVYVMASEYYNDNSPVGDKNSDYIFEDIGSGYSYVKLRNQSYENGTLGIAKDRKLILPVIFNRYYDKAKPDCIILKIENQFGVFNAVTQKWVIPLECKEISKLNDNYLSVKKDNQYAVFSNLGEKIEDFNWDYMSTSGIPNYIQIVKNNKKGLYNLINKKITAPCIYDDFDFCESCGNLFVIKLNGLLNIIDANNNYKLKNWYEQLTKANYDIPNFIAKKENKMGIINYNEDIILPFDYLSIDTSLFSDGSLIAKNKEKKFGCVNIQGKTTLPFEYDNIELNYNESSKRIFNKLDKCGLLQMNQGTPYEIATCEYENIITYKNFFIGKKNGKMILLNNYNKPLNDFEFDSLELLSKKDYYATNNVFLGKIKEQTYLINTSGVLINMIPYKSIEKVSIVNLTNEYYSEKTENIFYKVVNDKNNMQLLDFDCNLIETNLLFDDIIATYNNSLIFKKNKKTGVYDLSSKKISTNAEYDTITPTNNGFLAILNGNYYLINYYDQTKTVVFQK